MTKELQSFVDIVRQFASDLGLPKVDVDKLVETHRKNFEALTQTALVASEGVKSLAAKQKEMVESAFREALDMARNFKPSGDPQQILAKQSELARKAFDAAIDHTREIAEQVRKSNAEALKIASDRIVASIAELRASIEQGGDRSTPIRLTHTTTRCRVLPVAGIKLGIGRRLCIASDAEQRSEGVERVEAPVKPKREFVEVGL